MIENVTCKSKIVFMGMLSVGKTTTINAICNRDISIRTNENENEIKTPRATVFIDTFEKNIEMKIENMNLIHKLQFWDTCGTVICDSFTDSYIKGATHIVIIFDITKSFPEKYANKILCKVNSIGVNNNNIILVGNKKDSKKKKVLCIKHILSFGEVNGIDVLFCSAKKLQNLDSIQNKIISISERLRKSMSITTLQADKENINLFADKIKICSSCQI